MQPAADARHGRRRRSFFFMPAAQPFMKIMGGLMLASTVGMAIAQMVTAPAGARGADGQRAPATTSSTCRRRGGRCGARRARSATRSSTCTPRPSQLWSLVAEGSRVWERRAGDEDFGQVRLGPRAAAAGDSAGGSGDRAGGRAGAADRARDAAVPRRARHAWTDLPLAVSLRAFYHVTVSGDPETVYGASRALVAQLVHAALARGPGGRGRGRAGCAGASGSGRSGCRTRRHRATSTAPAPAADRRRPRRDRGAAGGPAGGPRPRFNPRGAAGAGPARTSSIVLDGGDGPAGLGARRRAEGLQGVTIVEVVPGELDETARRPVRAWCGPGRLRLESASGAVYDGVPRRAVAARGRGAGPPARAAADGLGGDDDEPLLANLDFTDLLNLGDAGSVDVVAHLAAALACTSGCGCRSASARTASRSCSTSRRPRRRAWARTACASAPPVPASRSCCAPWCWALAVTHSSETLNFVLADFKGGATFAGMSRDAARRGGHHQPRGRPDPGRPHARLDHR